MNAISKTIKNPCEFIQISDCSSCLNIEKLVKAFQNSLTFHNPENSSILEGEVVSIEYNFSSFDKKKCSSGRITLDYSDMESTYQFGPFLGTALFKAKIKTGDLIILDIASCSVVKRDLSSK